MEKHIHTEAVAAAQQLLHSFKAQHPTWTDNTTPIDELVSWYGLEVATFHPDDQPPGTYGWLEPGEDLIWLRRNLPETLRRFTLAHELAHAVLHRYHSQQPHTPQPSYDDPCQTTDIQEEITTQSDQKLEEVLGIGQSYNPRSQRELAANIFAAELLMPLERVQALYLTQQTPPQQLTTLFAVSTSAMLNRLAGLLEQQRKGSPSYLSGRESSAHESPGRDKSRPYELRPGAEGSGPSHNTPPRLPQAPSLLQNEHPISPKKHHDEFQQAAIAAPSPALIVAGPGSGKTSTLIGRAEYLIHTLAIPPQHILALTFSRKAAQEMQERLQQTLNLTHPQDASPTVSTFHAFCADLLRRYGERVGLRPDFTFIDDAEGFFLLRQLAGRPQASPLRTNISEPLPGRRQADAPTSYDSGDPAYSGEDLVPMEGLQGLPLQEELILRHYQHLRVPTYYFPEMLQAISRAKDELVTPEQYQHLAQQMLAQAHNEEETLKAEQAEEIAAIYASYQARLQQRGDTDFGGLIMLTIQLLRQHPEILSAQQEQYQHILVDEFQDMNRASGVLLHLLASAGAESPPSLASHPPQGAGGRDKSGPYTPLLGTTAAFPQAVSQIPTSERSLWVVGDANQAIYGFRGASPANITNFKDDYPSATVLPLNRNYRSRPDIVSLADAFRRAQLEQDTAAATTHTARSTEPHAYITVATATDEASELAGLIADMQHKHTEHGYGYRDMVVLCRTRAQTRKISNALAHAGLPVIERGSGSMLEQEHIQDLLSILLLLTESSGMGILRAARQSAHPLPQSDIEALLLAAHQQKTTSASFILRDEAPPHISTTGRRSLTRLAETLQALHHAPSIWSMLAQYLFIETPIMRDLLYVTDSAQAPGPHSPYGRDKSGPYDVRQGYAPTIDDGLLVTSGDSTAQSQESAGSLDPAQADHLRADYATILQLARHYDQRQQQEDAAARPIQEQAKGFLDYLNVIAMLRQDSAYRQPTTTDDSAESPDAIRVITVHASKGLEFPIVYLPGLVQRRFPMQAHSSPISAPAGMLPTQTAHNIHDSGEACLFYVALTRARDHLILSYSERYGKQNYKPSPYLDALLIALPPDRITTLYWQAKGDEGQGVLGGEGLRMEQGEQGSSIVDPDHRRPQGSPHDPTLPPPLLGTTGAFPKHSRQKPTDERIGDAPLSLQPTDSFIEAMQPTTLTISAIETYQTCPRRYLYSNIYHFRREDSAYQLFWQATQKTLEALQTYSSQATEAVTDPASQEAIHLPTQQEAQDLYMQQWRALGGHELPFASIYEQHGREIVASLCSILATDNHSAWQLRRSFAVEVAGTTIGIEVDRVEAPTQANKPVRFVRTRIGKSSQKPTAQVRELLYTQAYRQHHPQQSIEVHHHNLSTGETHSIKLTEKREQKLYEELEQTIKGLQDHAYPATPDSFICPTCPFFLICPA